MIFSNFNIAFAKALTEFCFKTVLYYILPDNFG
ncbi:hypothetical protein EO216_25235 [Flammeovirga kamogawensis]|nr:hypothetical protein EO216_25235 [Flammeovirga kamogawensis]